jgi:hypothetical protein
MSRFSSTYFNCINLLIYTGLSPYYGFLFPNDSNINKPRSKLRTTKGKGMLPALTQDGSQDINKNVRSTHKRDNSSRLLRIRSHASTPPAHQRCTDSPSGWLVSPPHLLSHMLGYGNTDTATPDRYHTAPV